MKKYLAFDGINGGHEDFDTIEEARKWLEDCFLSPDEGYHPDFASCKIYQLAETVECDVVDKKENYKYTNEGDIPEDDNESEAWPYDTSFDEIWKHRFVPHAAQQKPPSSTTAEEIIESILESLGDPINIHNHAFEIRPYTVDHKTEWWIFHKEVSSGEPLAQWLSKFAALHAQKIADKMVEATKDYYPKEFTEWVGQNNAILYYVNIRKIWVRTRFVLGENPHEEYDEYTTEQLFNYWKEDEQEEHPTNKEKFDENYLPDPD